MSTEEITLVRKWCEWKDGLSYGLSSSPSFEDLDNTISALYKSWTAQNEILENGRDVNEWRRLRKCRNCEEDFINLDLEYGPMED